MLTFSQITYAASAIRPFVVFQGKEFLALTAVHLEMALTVRSRVLQFANDIGAQGYGLFPEVC